MGKSVHLVEIDMQMLQINVEMIEAIGNLKMLQILILLMNISNIFAYVI